MKISVATTHNNSVDGRPHREWVEERVMQDNIKIIKTNSKHKEANFHIKITVMYSLPL